ncbi:apoptotic chromatin condensation inducer 1b [Dunckerocampus dactyliophorus]|uniref:apoptotic chromatin condensation inducer 1b n=1 Tax=Dunckerocampus dactyliophorus TaxID=161453 RepID=UPI002406D3A4|nr:apoptotic chromatin condensation inducer 1b [Dunckerocampus dactyliophorus]
MADEDITLDGQPLQSLRVADLKAALEHRNLPKSGAKNKLIQRLKGALMLENLQKSSSSHSGLQPNSQIGEEMSQNSLIKQYLAKQQELLCQRMEREAQLERETAESPAVAEDEDQSDNDSCSSVSDMEHPMPPQHALNRTEQIAGGGSLMGEGMMFNQETPDVPGAKRQRATFPQGHKEPPAPSPPRAVASLSVRVLGQPDHQGLPPAVSRAHEKEGVAPREPGSAHPVLHLSRSAGVVARDQVHEESDEDDDSDSEDDDDWRPGTGEARKDNRAPPQPPQMPSAPSAAARSKRKLQLPQHIPPPHPHQNLMQLRHPTPPPSPPPNLFRLPDTPKQSPPDTDHKEGESSEAAQGLPPPAWQRQDSDSSSRSSSPEPLAQRRPGPLSMLVHKMESEEAGSAISAGTSQSLLQMPREKMEVDSKHQQDEVKERVTNELNKEKQADDNLTTATTETQDANSSSDSDSQSDSSSSSSSSSPVRVQSRRVRQLKKADLGQEPNEETKEKGRLLKREVSEPSLAAVSEADPDLEIPVAQQLASGAEQVNIESHLEESTTPKAFAARKISLANSKTFPSTTTDGGGGESDTVAVAGRKRRWGSSTAVTSKKPSISITTDSLKSLIPDIKVAQEAVVDLLHPEELQMSGEEDNQDNSQGDQDKGLKIRRTVTQVVAGDNQENGQGDTKEEQVEIAEQEMQQMTPTDKSKKILCDETCDTPDALPKKVSPSDSLVRRSISQQRSGVSVTIDDPVRSTKQPSPPRGKLSNIIHVTNLVRPFTLGQLKELLNQTGNVVEEGFWIDKIKSHCYVTYTTTEEAVATRAALHGVKWPQSNPKVLSVDFCEQDELDFHKGILKPNQEEHHFPQLAPPQIRLPPLMPERDKEKERDRDRGAAGVRDLWAERQREMERREQARGEREWDRDKIREFAKPGEERRSRSRDRERRRRERAKSKERRTEKKEKGEEAPAKLLDDLFLKTKAAPCIYWLPLTEEQAVQRLLERGERQKERERRLKEQKEEEEKRREEERKERLKAREKEGGSAMTTSRGAGGRRADADRDKERGWSADGDRRREGDRRPGRPTTGTGAGWRSRSRSDTRDRRR